MPKSFLTEYRINVCPYKDDHTSALVPGVNGTPSIFEEKTGISFLDYFRNYINDRTHLSCQNERRKYYANLQGASEGNGYQLLRINSGRYGDSAEIMDTSTGEVQFTSPESSAVTWPSRILFACPANAAFVIFAVENRDGTAPAIYLDKFLKVCRQELRRSFKFQKETIMESDVWSKDGKLSQISYRVKGYQGVADPADSVDRSRTENVSADVNIGLKPSGREKFFPDPLWRKLANGDLDAYSMIALPEGVDSRKDPSVYVTVEKDGRQKTFELGTDGEPPLRELLTDGGQDYLKDDEFQERVLSNITELYGRSEIDCPDW